MGPACVKTRSAAGFDRREVWGSRMSRFVEGEDRKQPTLLPSCLDDYVAKTMRSR